MLCVCRLAKERYVRIQKERDYHRMHHRRVVQEKDKLLTDLKRYTLRTTVLPSIIVECTVG